MSSPVSERRRIILVAGLALAIPLVGGCSKKEVKEPEKPPPRLSIRIAAADDANQGGRPIVVRVYELKGQGAFATADFFSLYDRDAEVLGAELLARDEVTLAPGQFLPLERDLKSEAAYLGVVAAFRDIDRAQWRHLLSLKPGVDNRVSIQVGARSVSISQE